MGTDDSDVIISVHCSLPVWDVTVLPSAIFPKIRGLRKSLPCLHENSISIVALSMLTFECSRSWNTKLWLNSGFVLIITGSLKKLFLTTSWYNREIFATISLSAVDKSKSLAFTKLIEIRCAPGR